MSNKVRTAKWGMAILKYGPCRHGACDNNGHGPFWHLHRACPRVWHARSLAFARRPAAGAPPGSARATIYILSGYSQGYEAVSVPTFRLPVLDRTFSKVGTIEILLARWGQSKMVLVVTSSVYLQISITATLIKFNTLVPKY
eukprot:SAG31_NODE_772_length_12197_cov_7.075963_7_plen_142_part_00